MKTQSHRDAIRIDKISMLHKNIPFVLVSTLLGSMPLAMVVWTSSQENNLKSNVFIWALLHGILFISRGMHNFLFKKLEATAEQFFKYDNESRIFVALTGCLWGLSGYLFFDPEDVPTYSFLILTLVCMVSGSMNALSSRPWHFALFVIPTMLPIILLALLQNALFYLLMGIAAIIYVIATIVFNRSMHNAIHDSLSLKYQNSQLIEDLKIQTESANQANIDKSRFLAAASHDLRQPLHAANLFSDVLENEISDPNQRNILEHIRRGLSSMGDLFDALIDVARIDANDIPVNRSHFNAEPLIRDLVNQFSVDSKEVGITLSYEDCAYWIYSDPILLEQVLRNLISNAIKYTEKGNVEVFCRLSSNETVVIHIKDSGIGIAEGDLDRIFEEFTQLNNPERDRAKGLGLGLAIVRRLTNLLDHTLELKSKSGVGSEFILETPLANPLTNTGNETQGVNKQNHRLHGLSILLIDNEEEIVEATRLVLEQWGCQVAVRNTTDEALTLVRDDTAFDIVLSDFRMAGELDGVELIQEMRKIDPKLRGIIISGDKSSDIVRQAKEAELTLLHKPVKPIQLHMAINQVLRDK